MPTHLYCLLPLRSELTAPASGAVRVIDTGGVVAWASHTEAAVLSRDARDASRAAVEHDRVIGAALAQGVTPVPALLADAYGDDEALIADVRVHEKEIARALQRLQGMVEMTVIVAVADSAPPAEGSGRGRAYLEQLRSLPTRAIAIADRVAAELQGIGGTPGRRADAGRVSLSHLVPRAAISDYRGRALALAGEGYRIVIDGPRAPYSFARFSPRNGLLSDGADPAA